MRCTSSSEFDASECWSQTDRQAKREAEYKSLCRTLRQLIEGDALPPDEAYWWTRIALEEHAALSRITRLRDFDSPPDSSTR